MSDIIETYQTLAISIVLGIIAFQLLMMGLKERYTNEVDVDTSSDIDTHEDDTSSEESDNTSSEDISPEEKTLSLLRKRIANLEKLVQLAPCEAKRITAEYEEKLMKIEIKMIDQEETIRLCHEEEKALNKRKYELEFENKNLKTKLKESEKLYEKDVVGTRWINEKYNQKAEQLMKILDKADGVCGDEAQQLIDHIATVLEHETVPASENDDPDYK